MKARCLSMLAIIAAASPAAAEAAIYRCEGPELSLFINIEDDKFGWRNISDLKEPAMAWYDVCNPDRLACDFDGDGGAAYVANMMLGEAETRFDAKTRILSDFEDSPDGYFDHKAQCVTASADEATKLGRKWVSG
jgi:hypothetical protein